MDTKKTRVTTSVELALSFFLYHLGIYNEEFTCFDIKKVWVFDGGLFSDVIQVYIPCKNLSYLGKIALDQYGLEWY